jgi:hypothetical protein|tara:strand:- start:454 stop:1119 length:666 start_codon:yes stop_codon:yes gene_type:complete
MRDYITKRTNESYKDFNFRGVNIFIDDPLPENIDIKSVLRVVENRIPREFFKDIKEIRVGDYEYFDKRGINALYKDRVLYIANEQSGFEDLLDDIVHEIAHHVEQKYPEDIYGDGLLKREFLKKRKQLEFELRSEGYWTSEYDFEKIKFDLEFDKFLYDRIGKRLLNMVTSSIFIRPYASVSIREYFATGFEAYYLGKRDELFQMSPDLYNKINELDNSTK